MPRQESMGRCYLCKKDFGKATMSSHLKACRLKNVKEHKKSQDTQALHLVIEGKDNPTYWLHVETDAKAALGHLDALLRDVWLECCGHMSAFEPVRKKSRSARLGAGRSMTIELEDPLEEFLDDFGGLDMSTPLGKVLAPKQMLHYTYDFGSSTHLVVKCLSAREAKLPKNWIEIQARNHPPDIRCGVCGKPATQICSECSYQDEGWLCKACAKKHECGEEMLLPVVNSPRTGVCGYTG